MRKAKIYLLNALTVAGVGLLLRFAGMAYNVYISGKLGAEGMGLLSLVTSVYALAVTFASSGVNLTCTRLAAAALELKNGKEARRSLFGCALYSLAFGLFSAALLFSLSGVIGDRVLSLPRAAPCLRALCPALPAVSLSACFSGWFSAVRKAYKTSVVSVFEQGARILLTALFFSLFLSQGKDVEGVLYASCLSELSSFVFLSVFLFFEKRKTPDSGRKLPGLARRICGISLPIAVAAWIRSGLVTAEHVLIPKGLEAFGDPSALGTYGIMHGMALPVVFFPYAVLTPFTALLIPEFSRFKAENNERDISFAASLTLRLTLLFSFGCAALFAAFGNELGEAMYHVDGVGKMVSLFALLIPVMYLDTSVDAVLKGLGEQLYCMKVNIADAALSLALVFFLVPRVGAFGYLLTVFISECFNTLFSFLRLLKRTTLSLPFLKCFLLPAACAFFSALLSRAVFSLLSLPFIPRLAAALSFCLLFYALLLLLSGALLKQDKRYLFRLLSGK